MGSKKESKCYKQLTYKAGQFIKYIAKRSLYGKIALVRDYMIKVKIIKGYEGYGNFSIYYKPSKKKYSFDVREIDNPIMKEYLDELWNDMNKEAIREGATAGKYIIYINPICEK